MTENRENYIKFITISLVSLALILLSPFLSFPIYLSAIFLLLFIIIFEKIEWGVYLIALFLPVINFNIYLSSLQIPLIDVLGGFVFFIYLIHRFLRRDFEKIEMPHIVAFSLFILATFVSSMMSENIFESLWYSIRWILFFYLVYIVLPVNIIKEERILKNVLIYLSLSSFLVAFMGFVSILTQDWVYSIARAKPIELFGIFFIGENQNLMVESILPGIFSLIALKYWVKNKAISRFINLIVLFLSMILLLTFSRGAWLALFLMSMFMAVVYYRKNIFKFVVPMFLVLLIILPLIVYMINLQATYSVGVSSNNSRLLLIDIAVDGFKSSPLWGKGTGEYINLVADNVRFRASYGDPVDSHGVLQKILVENGILGIITFGFFIGAILKKYLLKLKDREYIELYLPLIASSLSLLIFELFNTSYYKGKLWFVVAISIVAINLIQEKKIHAK